ncbi:MAG: phage protein Gp36 family protein [Dehalococcoidia bacterium]|jgi:phage gp36-like protein
MPYSSATSILLILPDLPDTATTTDVINRHITRADALINAKITSRYETPIAPTPPLLGSLSEDIVTFYSYRSYYRQDNSNRTDFLDSAKEAFATLDEIRDGKIDLVDSSGSQIAERSEEATGGILDSTTKDYQPFFDVDDELDHAFDDDLIDNVMDKR